VYSSGSANVIQNKNLTHFPVVNHFSDNVLITFCCKQMLPVNTARKTVQDQLGGQQHFHLKINSQSKFHQSK